MSTLLLRILIKVKIIIWIKIKCSLPRTKTTMTYGWMPTDWYFYALQGIKKWINTNETNCYFIKINNFEWNELKNGSLIGSYEEKECYYDYVSLVDISRQIFVKLTTFS